MKKVTKEESFVNLKRVGSKKIYGALSQSSSMVGLIHKSEYFNGTYGIYCLTEFTLGNKYGRYDRICNLEDYVDFLLSCGIEVYEFDTLSEFAIWAEKEQKNSLRFNFLN